MRRSFAVALLLVFVGCSGNEDGSPDVGGQESPDQGAMTDAGAADVSGAADVGDEIADLPCSSYSGMGPVGTVYEYEVEFPGPTFDAPREVDTVTYEIVDKSADGEAIDVVAMLTFPPDRIEGPFINSEHTFRCDAEGLWFVGKRNFFDARVREISYEPARLLVPADIAVGKTWSNQYTSSAENVCPDTSPGCNVDPNPVSANYVDNYEVVGMESVAVTAGTFDVLRVEGDQALNGMASLETGPWFLDAEAGVVQAFDTTWAFGDLAAINEPN